MLCRRVLWMSSIRRWAGAPRRRGWTYTAGAAPACWPTTGRGGRCWNPAGGGYERGKGIWPFWPQGYRPLCCPTVCCPPSGPGMEGAAALAWMRANARGAGLPAPTRWQCGLPPGDIWRAAWPSGYAEPLLNERLGRAAGARPCPAIRWCTRPSLGLEPLGRAVLAGTGPPARLSLGHGGGRHGAGGKYPGLCPRPAGAALQLHLFQDGRGPMGLADRESAPARPL